MRSTARFWKVFAVVQLVGVAAMVVGAVFHKIQESPVIVFTWAVCLLPGIVIGKPLISRVMPVLDTPDAILVPLTMLFILVVNAACWFLVFAATRFVIRRLKGLTKRSSQPLATYEES